MDCVFCKIVRGEIPSEKIAENDEFVAFLGIYPKFSGMTVIATKKHTNDSYLYRSLEENELLRMHSFAREVALKLDESLGSIRCIQVMEGLETTHAHLKLFPLYEGKDYGVHFEGEKIVDKNELVETAEKIRKIK